MHDKKFLQYRNCLTASCMTVFDRVYSRYLQFAKWTEEGIFFVCRLKDNAGYEVAETLFEQAPAEKQAGVMKVEHIQRNFQLHFFCFEGENGIKTQVWATLTAHLLLTVPIKKSNTKKAFSTVAASVRIHFTSYLDLFWVIENGR